MNRVPRVPGAIERGWLTYLATVVPDVETEHQRVLLRLAYFAGAADALSQLGTDDEDHWPSIAARLALEVCDETDRLMIAVLGRGELDPGLDGRPGGAS